jgi:hypothetical protein
MKHLMWLVIFVVLACGELVLTRWIGGLTTMRESALISVILAGVTVDGLRRLARE